VAGPDSFLGYPLYVSPDLAAVGANAKAAVFADFNLAYIIRQVNGLFTQRQSELHSDSGQIGFRAFHRSDERVGLTAAARVIAFAAT
jgi:HK97 family phage major capsid protein